MSVAFMGVFAAMIGERVGRRAGAISLAPLVLAGVGSVLWWHATELRGTGDLRPYGFVQFFPLLAIPLLIALFAPSWTRGRDLLVAAGFYGLAKLLEALDGPVYDLTGVVSGHTLKHLAASLAPVVILRMLRRRTPI
jgi:hypothetical protein